MIVQKICTNKRKTVGSSKKKIVLSKSVKTELMKYQHKNLFYEGSFVFAKLRGHRPWPAQITKTQPRGAFEVKFYGTNDFGIATISNMYQYSEVTTDVFGVDDGTSKLSKQFGQALIEIKEGYEENELETWT